jgi:hypothetical protein
MNTSPWYTPIPVGTVTAEQRALINREIAQHMIAKGMLVQPGHGQRARTTGFHEKPIGLPPPSRPPTSPRSTAPPRRGTWLWAITYGPHDALGAELGTLPAWVLGPLAT